MIPLFRPVIAVDAALGLIEAALRSGYIGEGPRCAELERALRTVLGLEHLLLTNSGTSALKLAFASAGATHGAEVVTTPVTCSATPMAAADAGASVVWADVDPETGNLDPDDAARQVTSRTAAVCAVDWAGRPCDLERLRALARGLSIVEDAAHAFGRPRGQRGADYVCFSYQSIKHLGMADGGAVACPGDATAADVRRMRWFGLDRARGDSMRCYQRVERVGYKCQSNDVLASLGLANLPRAVEAVARCRETARWVIERLPPYVRSLPYDEACSYWMLPVKVSDPVRFELFMRSAGCEVGQVHSRCDVQPCFRSSAGRRLPGVDEFFAHQSNLPCMPHVGDRDREVLLQMLDAWSRRPEARW